MQWESRRLVRIVVALPECRCLTQLLIDKTMTSVPSRGWFRFSRNCQAVEDVDIVRQPNSNCIEVLLNIVEYGFHRHDITPIECICCHNMAIDLVGFAVNNPRSGVAIANALRLCQFWRAQRSLPLFRSFTYLVGRLMSPCMHPRTFRQYQ
jgi:hypothetical protein